MACKRKQFVLDGEWERTELPGGAALETAEAHTGSLAGVVYKMDGVFQGFVGSKAAARWWAERKQDGPAKNS